MTKSAGLMTRMCRPAASRAWSSDELGERNYKETKIS